MAFSGNIIPTSFKLDLLRAQMNFTTGSGNTFNMALYTNSATLIATTAAYTATGEHGATGTYTVGGKALTLSSAMPVVPSGVTAVASFDPLTWAASTITARGAMVYNITNANKSVVILDFGADKSSSAGDFTVTFPPADAAQAIIRIA